MYGIDRVVLKRLHRSKYKKRHKAVADNKGTRVCQKLSLLVNQPTCVPSFYDVSYVLLSFAKDIERRHFCCCCDLYFSGDCRILASETNIQALNGFHVPLTRW